MKNWRNHSTVFAVVFILSAVAVGSLLRIGWIPNDEGTLATSASRVLHGQLPQRDFAEIYTGGLSLWHAQAFRAFGENLFSLRVAVFLVFLIWLPALYWIASRFLPSVWAGIATLTAVCWSYPNYVAAMPSWYNLFLATFAVAFILSWVRSHRRLWLVAAGVCVGLSILVKVTGLYCLAGVLLFALWAEQTQSIRHAGVPGSAIWYRTFTSLGLLCFLGCVLQLVGVRGGFGTAYLFLVPSVGCIAMLAFREVDVEAKSVPRFKRLFGITGSLLGGLFLPLAAFVIPYVHTSSLRLLLKGVASSAAQRATELAGRSEAPGLMALPYALSVLTIVAIAVYSPWAGRRKTLWIVGAILFAVVLCSGFFSGLQDTWLMAGMLMPLTALAACKVSLRDDEALLVFVGALCSLVQFPFPYVTYFCYAAPLVLLATVAVSLAYARGHGFRSGAPLQGLLLIFFLLLGVFGVASKHTYSPKQRYSELRTLPIARAGGLLIEDDDDTYRKLIPFLLQHAPHGAMYAGNDCPELYFLSGLRNPTRDDTGAHTAEVLAALQSGAADVVVLNEQPFLKASAVPAAVRVGVETSFPYATKIGKFTVYWR